MLALLCAACMVPAYPYLWLDYTRFTVGIAGAAVALAALLGLPEPIAALDRLIDTLVGLAIIRAFLAPAAGDAASAGPRPRVGFRHMACAIRLPRGGGRDPRSVLPVAEVRLSP